MALSGTLPRTRSGPIVLALVATGSCEGHDGLKQTGQQIATTGPVAIRSRRRALSRWPCECGLSGCRVHRNLKNGVDGLKAPFPHEFSFSLASPLGLETLSNELGPAMEGTTGSSTMWESMGRGDLQRP
ncbi:hypothetical protein Taro_053194 [Colocasia esculenta]|uniref:Uncharacterized protein n=1 Tax=Colocasia esculenta TaxID=4460 RepID=A0A843XK91_COLES|nr:hypothetical protein [Colocasia esculenta]